MTRVTDVKKKTYLVSLLNKTEIYTNISEN